MIKTNIYQENGTNELLKRVVVKSSYEPYLVQNLPNIYSHFPRQRSIGQKTRYLVTVDIGKCWGRRRRKERRRAKRKRQKRVNGAERGRWKQKRTGKVVGKKHQKYGRHSNLIINNTTLKFWINFFTSGGIVVQN